MANEMSGATGAKSVDPVDQQIGQQKWNSVESITFGPFKTSAERVVLTNFT